MPSALGPSAHDEGTSPSIRTTAPFTATGTPGIVGGQKKHGSKFPYAYATAAIIHRRHRYTVGLMAWDGKYKPHEMVAALLAQVQQRGLRVRGVAVDSSFASGETLLLLQGRGLSSVVPLRRKGRAAIAATRASPCRWEQSPRCNG